MLVDGYLTQSRVRHVEFMNDAILRELVRKLFLVERTSELWGCIAEGSAGCNKILLQGRGYNTANLAEKSSDLGVHTGMGLMRFSNTPTKASRPPVS